MGYAEAPLQITCIFIFKIQQPLSNNLASLSTNKCNITWCPNKQTTRVGQIWII